MRVLVTGAAGFIGSKLAWELAQRGDSVVGLDNINTYYNPNIKYARLQEMGFTVDPSWEKIKAKPETGSEDHEVEFPDMEWGHMLQSSKLPNLRFMRLNIIDREALSTLFKTEEFDHVMNLAAQAGVRYSIKNPFAYVESNIVGFLNLLECCRLHNIEHLVYASSSSVYGMNKKVPFSEDDEVISPASIYAATKKSDELMAFVYSKLYNLHTTGLRYFTVYGPWGRPDMAPMLFAHAISAGKPINVFNNGDLIRDFTYIDDIVEGTIKAIDHTPNALQCKNNVPAKVYNIGCSSPIKLMDFISNLERSLGLKAKINFMPMQPGDVYQTNANTTKLEKEIGYKPSIKLSEGIKRFVEWYKSDKNTLK